MSAHKDFVKANEQYVASFGDKGSLSIVPAKKLVVGAYCSATE
jgi:carbonic anhydrase